jgi:hypothetical protein
MAEDNIVSAPIRINLLDISRLYEQEHTEYSHIIIEPSPCHYPHLIDSAMDSHTKPLISSTDTESEQVASDDSCDCILSFFRCCK